MEVKHSEKLQVYDDIQTKAPAALLLLKLPVRPRGQPGSPLVCVRHSGHTNTHLLNHHQLRGGHGEVEEGLHHGLA